MCSTGLGRSCTQGGREQPSISLNGLDGIRKALHARDAPAGQLLPTVVNSCCPSYVHLPPIALFLDSTFLGFVE